MDDFFGDALYMITIAGLPGGQYRTKMLTAQMPVFGLEPEPIASDLPAALYSLAEALPDGTDEPEFVLDEDGNPTLGFLITVHRQENGRLKTALGAAGAEDGVPVPVNLADYIRQIADTISHSLSAGSGAR